MGEPYQGSPINAKITKFNSYHNFIFTKISLRVISYGKLIIVNIKL